MKLCKEQHVTIQERQAKAGAILLLNGIFLYRLELRAYWDLSVWLEVALDEELAGALGDGEVRAFARVDR